MNPATRLPPTPATQANFNVAYIWTISLVAALGGLLFGYDWVVIGGAKPFFERHFISPTPPNPAGRTVAP